MKWMMLFSKPDSRVESPKSLKRYKVFNLNPEWLLTNNNKLFHIIFKIKIETITRRRQNTPLTY